MPEVGKVWLGPGKVIAQRLGAIAAKEHATRVFDQRQQRKGVVGAHFQMLGGDGVGNCHGGSEVRHHDGAAIAIDGFAGDGPLG